MDFGILEDAWVGGWVLEQIPLEYQENTAF